MFENLSEKTIAETQAEQVKHWNDIDLLDLCIKAREGSPSFVFYEGPPTANGKPGIHHVMARTLKDSINRYKTMKGYQVKRKAGWDTHGLPVEIEVEKQLSMSGKQDIEKFGIKEFNEKCRESVFKYTKMWTDMSEKMAYLADMEDPYITYKNDYIESGWWILKKFFDAGLIYEGHKVLPYCARCGTGLASHEVAQGYKEDTVLTLTCKFKRKGINNEYFLAWTTTAWTLPSNIIITVGPDVDYVRAEMLEGNEKGNIFYVAEKLADKVLGEGNYKVLEKLKGKELEHIEYEPLTDFVYGDEQTRAKNGVKGFFVACADYVTTEDGTGLVHTAYAFGEDDYNTCRCYGVTFAEPVDERGCFTTTPWQGRFVMEEGLDVDILKYLISEEKIFTKQKMTHNYPHCWRCGTPLVYYSSPSWYIEMSKLKSQLVENNSSVNWYPEFVGEKRFGNWLAEVKDWAISRSRYWGTPVPIWRCECGELECIGSREELAKKAMEKVDPGNIELHRPYVDDIHIKCPKCGKKMNRVPEVMDCWFDSGAMPFAQWHYPFENEDRFESELFPADFICEGIDQTRGWFYSLMAISTFISGKAPYRNVLVNDLILDKNGKKMSKSKGNTVDPFALLEKYGADALRWYLISVSPAWTPTRFDEDGVKEVISKFFGTLKNIYNFFILYSNLDNINPDNLKLEYSFRPELDRWIISRCNKLIDSVTDSMNSYDHMKTVRAINDFVVEDFSNWYIRRARRRFYANGMDDDKSSVFATTYEVLVAVVKLIAPFAPFISDEMYIKLTGEKTVHIADYPVADASLIDEKAEERMGIVKTLVNLGRGTREKERLKVRQPLSEVIVDGKYESIIGDLVPLIEEELNVKKVVFEKDLDKYMNFIIKPNFKTAGPILGKNINEFAQKLAEQEPKKFIGDISEGAVMMILGGRQFKITEDFLDIRISAKDGFVVGMENNVFTILDTTLTSELVAEGYVREVISKVQQLRKQHDFEMMDNINIYIDADDEVKAAVKSAKEHIMKETLAKDIITCDVQETFDINGHTTGIMVEKI